MRPEEKQVAKDKLGLSAENVHSMKKRRSLGLGMSTEKARHTKKRTKGAVDEQAAQERTRSNQ